ncbi:MAG: hypothetical protein KatS3mg105_0895 [Gemmatales bacterium]|nr:MAG: hypothetical protein KatS3mg105_0895 [Gemmatales bacterium]
MRNLGKILTAWLVFTAAAQAQPAQEKLDRLLQQWEAKMTAVQTLKARCIRTTVDKVFETTDVYEGEALYMKPNMASLEMYKRNKPSIYEKYICTGTYLYEFVPANKVIRVHTLPQGQANNFLSFFFGMKAQDAKQRYNLRLSKEDDWYYYIEITPRLPEDKVDFQRARLVLNKNTFLPRELWFMQPNKNEVKWDLPNVQSGIPLNRSQFAPPANSGWKLERVPQVRATRQNVPPRVIRPNR